MTDTENDPHITTTEKYEILSSAVAETWDLIISSGRGDEYVKSVSFVSVAGQREYPIATVVAAGDFYKVTQMYVDEGSGQLRPIIYLNPAEIGAYRPPQASANIKMYYLPCAPVWTNGSGSFDGINGWEEHTLATAAITVMNKKKDAAQPFESRKRSLEQRIQTVANRDQAEPARVVRKRRSLENERYVIWNNTVSRWNVRGINIELFYNYGYAT